MIDSGELIKKRIPKRAGDKAVGKGGLADLSRWRFCQSEEGEEQEYADANNKRGFFTSTKDSDAVMGLLRVLEPLAKVTCFA